MLSPRASGSLLGGWRPRSSGRGGHALKVLAAARRWRLLRSRNLLRAPHSCPRSSSHFEEGGEEEEQAANPSSLPPRRHLHPSPRRGAQSVTGSSVWNSTTAVTKRTSSGLHPNLLGIGMVTRTWTVSSLMKPILCPGSIVAVRDEALSIPTQTTTTTTISTTNIAKRSGRAPEGSMPTRSCQHLPYLRQKRSPATTSWVRRRPGTGRREPPLQGSWWKWTTTMTPTIFLNSAELLRFMIETPVPIRICHGPRTGRGRW
jgi:hypothetical protein